MSLSLARLTFTLLSTVRGLSEIFANYWSDRFMSFLLIFSAECLYNTKAQLAKKLRYFCRYPEKTRNLQVCLAVLTVLIVFLEGFYFLIASSSNY